MLKKTALLALLLLAVTTIAFAGELKEQWRDGAGTYQCGELLKGLAVSADGSALYTLDKSSLRVWDTADGTPQHCMNLEYAGEGPSLSDDGKFIMLSYKRKLRVLTTAGFEEVYSREFAQDEPGAMAFAGDWLIVGTKGGKLWKGKIDKEDSWELVDERVWGRNICRIAKSPDGEIAVCGGDMVRVYDGSMQFQWEKKFSGIGLFSAHFVVAKRTVWLVTEAFLEVHIFLG